MVRAGKLVQWERCAVSKGGGASELVAGAMQSPLGDLDRPSCLATLLAVLNISN